MKRPKPKPLLGISKDTEKAIEDAIAEALSDDMTNPTSRFNMQKGRNNPAKYGRSKKFSLGGDVRYNENRGKTF